MSSLFIIHQGFLKDIEIYIFYNLLVIFMIPPVLLTIASYFVIRNKKYKTTKIMIALIGVYLIVGLTIFGVYIYN